MATAFRNKKNWPLGVGSLNADISGSDLTIVLNAGQGVAFPSASFTVTIDEEIVLIDSRSTDTLTVNASGRGYDGSTASAHAAGTAIANLQIVKDFTDLEAALNAIENGTVTLAKVVTSGSAANKHTVEDSGTDTVLAILELYHMGSGTPASGLGASIYLGAKNSNGDAEAAIEIQGYLATVTDGAEDGVYKLRLKRAGSFQDAFTVSAGANSTTITSGQTTLNCFNTVATTVNAWGAATAIAMGAAGASLTLGANTGTPQIILNGASGTNRFIRFYIAGANNWAIGAGASNVFTIARYSGGVFQGSPFQFDTAGNLTISESSTQTVSVLGRLLPRSVTDAGPMTATAGTQREIVFNTSDSKAYVCTVTGSPATWAALN